MRTFVKLERVETNWGVVKIEGEINGAELVVQKLLSMSTDGWEEIDPNCSWAEALFDSDKDVLIERITKKHGASAIQVVRIVGS